MQPEDEQQSQRRKPPRQSSPLSQHDQRETLVKQKIQEAWDACKRNCLCLGTAITTTTASCSQGSEDHDQNCPYALLAEKGGQVCEATSRCRNRECGTCALVNQLDVDELTDLGQAKNTRLSLLLRLSEFVAVHMFCPDATEEERKDLSAALCSLLCCGLSRLRNIANVGALSQYCPNLIHLQLSRGWGEFWNNLSKIGCAVAYQALNRNQLATFLYLRHTCVPRADSPWQHYLQTEDLEQEQEIFKVIFAGSLGPQPNQGREAADSSPDT